MIFVHTERLMTTKLLLTCCHHAMSRCHNDDDTNSFRVIDDMIHGDYWVINFGIGRVRYKGFILTYKDYYTT